ncbi:PhnA domain-containing protein [Aliarcobacter cibarius]|uniref:PhnA domain-containing protein n=1 Tax=Aliarcobacter cibarius TaxID=255507 RepID=A0A7L5JRE5_9BACT|nr:alkylphosphonate utilization protein [Aliarcobacter cibarius]QKJ27804.1 PhnA domain-containing protein [Aliarcobacter cibarius]TLT04937.1 PhnA domain protein [Aliarcobacter cibarius]
MNIEQELLNRSDSSCELCKSTQDLTVFEVSPSDGSIEQVVLLCNKCKTQFEDDSFLDENHWFCLSDSMWSTVPAVQVLSYRMLKKLGNQDLLDMMYLEDDVRAWAEAGISKIEDGVVHKDCNGVVLNAGDTVTIIKDLDVKGAGFTAKRGTAVRNISLTSNPEQIEGRVNGVKIVILTQYLKKS